MEHLAQLFKVDFISNVVRRFRGEKTKVNHFDAGCTGLFMRSRHRQPYQSIDGRCICPGFEEELIEVVK